MHYRSMFSGVSPQIVLSGPSEKWRKEKAMDTVDQSLPKRMVESAISGLRPRTRNVVELIHLQEHSIRETAQILGISTGGSKVADVSRENRIASNALAAKCRQFQLC